MAGKSRVLIGKQYGDEGKARVMDKLIKEKYPQTRVVVRFNGGPNAGHTLENELGKIALHQVPSGIFYPNAELYIGSGCVLNPVKLINEMKEIESLGMNLGGRFFISEKVPLIQPAHILLDKVYGKKIGTTGNGIGQSYADQAQRMQGEQIVGLRFADYVADPEFGNNIIRERLVDAIEMGKLDISTESRESLIVEFEKSMLTLSNFGADPLYLERMASEGHEIFFEGAQSIMLDNVTGTYPGVTSSRTLAASAYVGGDLSMKYHEKTIGVAKAIMSRVGNGPFVSEFGRGVSEAYCDEKDEFGKTKHTREFESTAYDVNNLAKSNDLFKIGKAMRIWDGEYGATTLRPRRIGMLDLVMLRQNARLNGVDELYLTKMDSLGLYANTSLEGIPFVTAYELDGKTIDYIPSTNKLLARATPVIEFLPHFPTRIKGQTDPLKLPKEVFKVVEFVEERVGISVKGFGTGPKRDQFVFLER